MANYFGSWRSNHFKPRDLDAFIEWAGSIKGTDWAEENGLVVLYQDDADGGLPSIRMNDDDEVEIDFLVEFGAHVASDSVAIIMEIGSEKLRYLVGTATAIRGAAEGEDGPETIQISLEDIYERAEAAWPGVEVTPASI